MSVYIIIDIFLFLLFEIYGRICCRDAVNYKRNKSKQKQFYKEHRLIFHLFRLYTPSMSYAPRHLLWFQIFRAANLGLFITGLILLLIHLSSVYRLVFYVRLFVLYVPAVVWGLYVVVTQSGRVKGKQIDFDSFEKP